MGRKKSALEKKLEESIKAVKRGEIGPNSRKKFSDRLRDMDDVNKPSSLDDPDSYKEKDS